MNSCENCRHTNHLGLPDWSTIPCAVCARFGANNAPTMWEAKPQTNHDRIVSKTPEELARWIWAVQSGIEHEDIVSTDGWLDWLREKAKE